MVLTAGSKVREAGHIEEDFHSAVKGTGSLEIRAGDFEVLGHRCEGILTKLDLFEIEFMQNRSVTFGLFRTTQSTELPP